MTSTVTAINESHVQCLFTSIRQLDKFLIAILIHDYKSNGLFRGKMHRFYLVQNDFNLCIFFFRVRNICDKNALILYFVHADHVFVYWARCVSRLQKVRKRLCKRRSVKRSSVKQKILISNLNFYKDWSQIFISL